MKKIIHAILMFAVVGLFTASAAPRPANKAIDAQGIWTGTVSNKDGKYFLTQEGTDVTVELRGSGLAKHAGSRVQLTWTALPEQTPAPGASQVVLVAQVDLPGAPTIPGGAKAAGTSAKAGLSKAAVAGIGAGASGATIGSLYAADVLGGEDQPASRP